MKNERLIVFSPVIGFCFNEAVAAVAIVAPALVVAAVADVAAVAAPAVVVAAVGVGVVVVVAAASPSRNLIFSFPHSKLFCCSNEPFCK